MLKVFYTKHPYFFNLYLVAFIFAITRTLDWLAWIKPYPGKVMDILIGQIFEFIAYLPIILLLLISYSWALKKNLKIILIIFILSFAVLCPTIIRFLTIELELVFWKKDIPPLTFELIKKFTPGGMVYILVLTATYFFTSTTLKYKQQREATHKAENLAKDVQLKMLRYQINPHFLFNVLNSVHALIDENKDKAKQLVVDMSEYYRFTLNKQQQTITVEKEVEAVRKYLEIQKTRFEDKFDYQIVVVEAANVLYLPSFVIHLLIENAVKYGVKSNEQKLIIKLLIKIENDTLFITVSNTGKLLPSTEGNSNTNDGTGNGLENIKNRLELFYNHNASFSLTEANGWVSAIIEIKNVATLSPS